MKYINFYHQFSPFGIVSLSTIRKFHPTFDRRRLSEWQQKGYLIQLKREYYLFSGVALNKNLLFYIANQLNPHSYISLEAALSFYQLVPEGVYLVTSVTSKKTNFYQTPIAAFKYQSGKRESCIGCERRSFKLSSGLEVFFKIAKIEKAILDYLYLHSELKNLADIEALRLNPATILQNLSKEKLLQLAGLFESKILIKKVNYFLKAAQLA